MNDIESFDDKSKQEIKEIIEDKKSAMELMKKYCPSAIFNAQKKESLNTSSFDFLISELAENALSADVTGKPGLNLNLICIEIDEVLNQSESISRLKKAEMHFLESLESVKKLEGLRHKEELEKTSDIIRSINLGISRFNVLFVLVLIVGLAWSALNLPKDALALVAASIGGAITHLLAERNTVLSMKKDKEEGSGGGCKCNSEE